MSFKSRTAKVTVATMLATSAVVFALVLAFLTNAVASSTAGVDVSNTATTQPPAVPIGLQPGCYVGTVSPFTITQVPCMFNSPPLGGYHEPTPVPTVNAAWLDKDGW